jgi:transposase InsO family protein
MAERFVDSFTTELISAASGAPAPARVRAIVEYVGWFNTTRRHESLGDLPPAEFETLSPSSRCIS